MSLPLCTRRAQTFFLPSKRFLLYPLLLEQARAGGRHTRLEKVSQKKKHTHTKKDPKTGKGYKYVCLSSRLANCCSTVCSPYDMVVFGDFESRICFSSILL
uniref:Putative secreted peptide n=1 Tax=Anopheles braziliensis TaxID=58242 RepID=A0A2M3ZQ61_9DIPT